MQLPVQSVVPTGHGVVQTPRAQNSFDAQVFPQPPQLSGSFEVVTHPP
jgi:hypothetical protein